MDPIPRMVIPTQLARRKGEVEVSTAAEADELISQLIIAKTGLLGAASAIGAKGAMDAAREVEAGRNGDGGVLFPAGPDVDEPAAAGNTGCPECSVSGGRHLANCKTGAKLAQLGERITALSEASPEPGADVVHEHLCLECGRRHGPQHDPAPEPAWDGDPKCGARHPGLGVGCEAHKPGLHIAPGLEPGDPDVTWPREPAPLASVTPMRPAMGPVLVEPHDDGTSYCTSLPHHYHDDPCPQVHPDKGTPCVGTAEHGPPCRDLDGDEWAPPIAGAS